MSFTAFWLALAGGGIAFILSVIAGWIKKPEGLRTRYVVLGGGALIVGAAVLGVVQISGQSPYEKSGGAPSASGATGAAGGGYPASPPGSASIKPFIAKKGYVLRRSSSIATNDQDKIDLDTGCPGWGGMHPRIGPSRCGETADVILDQEGVHAADNRPRFVELDHNSGGDFAGCQAALTAKPASSLSQVEVATLRADDRICVQTELDNIALVTIQTVSTDAVHQLQQLTIDFVVWRTQG